MKLKKLHQLYAAINKLSAVVQQRLGHSDVNITLNTYTHVLPEMDARGGKIRPDFATKSIG